MTGKRLCPLESRISSDRRSEAKAARLRTLWYLRRFTLSGEGDRSVLWRLSNSALDGASAVTVHDAPGLAQYPDQSEDRLIETCPRAIEVLKRQLALRARLKLAGKLNREELFFKDNGDPIRRLQHTG